MQSCIKMLIGLTGKKFSGKSTVARFLNEQYGFVEISYAEALKRACNLIFNVPLEVFNDPDKKEIILPEWGVSPRAMLQKIGSCAREIHPDVWIRLVEFHFSNLLPLCNVVISDIRYQNEADCVRAHGGYILEIIRPNNMNIDDHSSENQKISCVADYLYNDTTIEQLLLQIEFICDNVWKLKKTTLDKTEGSI